MPVNKKNNYTQKEFEKDLNELEKLIKNQKGGNNKEDFDEEDFEEENYEEEDLDDEEDEDEDDYEENEQYGGKAKYEGTYRHFKLVEVDGKKVDYGKSHIKEHQTPINAAKKILLSIALKKGLKANDKLKLPHTVFSIQETTRGSKKHGKISTYSGKYKKYTPEEMKKAQASGQSFKMKPIVKLHHEKQNHKGG